MPTANIPAVSTTTPRRDHDHATAEPDRAAVCITSGNAAPITNEAVAQHLAAEAGQNLAEADPITQPADAVAGPAGDDHGPYSDKGQWRNTA